MCASRGREEKKTPMKTKSILVAAMVCVLAVARIASADIFGVGANQFTIDFVTISGDTNPASGYGIVNNDHRMGVYEVTNDQWNKFVNAYGTVTGSPSDAYDESASHAATNLPTDKVSWYEAAQFVNWLNTSTGHEAAYKFTGTQGTSDYALAIWSAAEAAGGTNLYRHKDAVYYLPTEDEWVKAAYWNGAALQTYATKAGESLTQGDGVSGTGWNYYDNGYAMDPRSPWAVGSGSQELNGTFDMMGNLWEWMENPYSDANYGVDSLRAHRGGGYYHSLGDYNLASSTRGGHYVDSESNSIGFRVASVPEPTTLSLLAIGSLVLIRRRSGQVIRRNR